MSLPVSQHTCKCSNPCNSTEATSQSQAAKLQNTPRTFLLSIFLCEKNCKFDTKRSLERKRPGKATEISVQLQTLEWTCFESVSVAPTPNAGDSWDAQVNFFHLLYPQHFLFFSVLFLQHQLLSVIMSKPTSGQPRSG